MVAGSTRWPGEWLAAPPCNGQVSFWRCGGSASGRSAVASSILPVAPSESTTATRLPGSGTCFSANGFMALMSATLGNPPEHPASPSMASTLANAASRSVRTMPKVGSLPYHSKSLPACVVAGCFVPRLLLFRSGPW